ncbi:hypothetical protein EX30DRAFT_249443 [Ascodesmis nigricans]|uniref:Uncharacterized protein n=1 Tax=Ascodesmis nigricans TaxID=341454 RepID=A0A4S2MY09_9PEZI|nr:hypothetical protein EX30DRAFT_249443 [Ascodesmis nigricans]
MANAMKKLKLLHHLTPSARSLPAPPAATTHTATHQTQSTNLRPQIQQSSNYSTPASYNYNDYLRSARNALITIHTSQQQQLFNAPPPPPPPQPRHQLPGGFLTLTPTPPQDNPIPGLCVPASPPMAITTQPSMYNSNYNNLYSSRPPLSQHYRTSKPAPRLTRDNVSKIGKDSRLARWERVLSYVRSQRALCAAALEKTNSPVTTYEKPSSWKSYSSPRSPRAIIDRKRRAEELDAIEAKNRALDEMDREEMENRSLWSGGSAGTNGVDEFVWSEDEEDDILPMPTGPPPVKVFVMGQEEEGLWDMEEPQQLKMTPSSQEKNWTQRLVEELPVLCREGELEGGLGRLMGRRMSAAC